ncbi:MAG: hypothetical protein ABI425_01115 [Patescibacteria group bacterium]
MIETYQLQYTVTEEQQKLLEEITQLPQVNQEALKKIAKETTAPREAAACLFFLVFNSKSLSAEQKRKV